MRIDRQLVASDAAGEHFLLARGRVERQPFALLDERHRERPLLVADDERLAGGFRVDQVASLRRTAAVNTSRFRRAVAGSEVSTSSLLSGPKIADNCSTSAAFDDIRQRPHRLLGRREVFCWGRGGSDDVQATALRARPRSTSRRSCASSWPWTFRRQRRRPPPPPPASAALSARAGRARRRAARVARERVRLRAAAFARRCGIGCGRAIDSCLSCLAGVDVDCFVVCRSWAAVRAWSFWAWVASGRFSCRDSTAIGALLLRVFSRRDRSRSSDDVLAVVRPVLARVLAVVVVVVPGVVVHVGAAAPPVRTVVVVVVDGGADRDAGGEADHARRRPRRRCCSAVRRPRSCGAACRPSVGLYCGT